MTVRQLSIVAIVLGVAVILLVLGQSTPGVVFILLAGLAWALIATSTRLRAPSFLTRLARWALTVVQPPAAARPGGRKHEQRGAVEHLRSVMST